MTKLAQTVRLRVADDGDYAFCEMLSLSNMKRYLDARSIPWDPQRFAQNWPQFENYILCRSTENVGLLRLLELEGYLEIRDLQLLPAFQSQGIGSWAISQTACLAQQRAISALRLRVYEENPAQALYRRHGFEVVALEARVIHMVKKLDRSAAPGSRGS